jgi:glutathione S-transferase
MCSLHVIIVARPLNIPFEVQLIDVSKVAHKSPEYISKYQPFGRIPVLLDGIFSLFESLQSVNTSSTNIKRKTPFN